MFVCLYVCMYACMYLCIYVDIYKSLHVEKPTQHTDIYALVVSDSLAWGITALTHNTDAAPQALRSIRVLKSRIGTGLWQTLDYI